MSPAVSVVVPTYERWELVLGAVESVLAQTFEDFELIVVDDGSTDGTGEALDGLDPRIRYVWQENRGPAAARNAGIHLACAPIVAFLDSDDVWLPNHLAVVTEVFERFPQVVLVCTCPRQDIAGRQAPAKAQVVDPLPLLYGEFSIGLPSCVATVRAELLEIGGFRDGLATLEDADMYLRLAARGPFALVQHRTIVQQITPGSRHQRAMRSDGVLRAVESVAQVAVQVARDSQRPDRDDLRSRAQGKVHYAAAVRALVEGDDVRTRASLEQACRLVPELSRSPELVARRIANVSSTGASGRLSKAAVLWPDQRSDTAIFLRLLAAAAAAREGRFADATRLVARWPPAPSPAFLLRNRSTFTRLARRTIRHRRHRAAQSDAP